MEQDNIQEAILQDEQIDKFIRNKMTPEEEASFKANLANDPGLRERAFATAIMAKCMREKRQEEEKAFIEQLNESVAIDQDDRIERFIRDNMSPEEEAEFKDDLNYDQLERTCLGYLTHGKIDEREATGRRESLHRTTKFCGKSLFTACKNHKSERVYGNCSIFAHLHGIRRLSPLYRIWLPAA